MKDSFRNQLAMEISGSEKRLIEYLRQLRWGSAEITIQNGQPVLIKAAVKTVKLD